MKKRILFLRYNFVFLIFSLLVILQNSKVISISSQRESLFNQINSPVLTFESNNDNNIEELFNPYQNFNPNLTRIIYDIYFTVNTNGKDVSVSSHFTYQNTGKDDVFFIMHIIDITTILIDSRISTIDIYDAFGNLQYIWNIIGNVNLLNISLRNPIQENDFYSFTIDYLLENAIIKNMDVYQNLVLQWTITHDEDTQQFSLILNLPVKFTLYNQSALDPEANYKSADGRRVEWYFYNVIHDSIQTWIVRFNVYVTSPIITEPIGKGYWFGLIATFVFGFIVGSLAIFFILKSRTDIERKEIVETLLSSPEKEILRIIKNQNGVTTQSKITSESGFSKAKVSYYLTELENKEIISRERWGRMNRIKIADDSVDKVYFSEEKKDE
ncbi:MAG: MarR family transcriptional regulator [Candidatus Heimdallarchaeota archaeon]|nr:MarR family transcriptional regulator [Candidatus Heimdallarchaeota archaeon]